MNLLKNFSIYTLSSVINSGSAFFILPIISYYLQPEQNGYFSLFNLYVAVGFAFISFSLNGAVNVNYYKLSKDQFPSYLGTAFFINTILACFLFMIFIITPGKVQSNILTLPSSTILLIPALAFLKSIYQIVLVVLRCEDRPMNFMLLNSLYTVLFLGFSVLFLKYIEPSWMMLVYALSASLLLCFLVSLSVLKNYNLISIKINRKYLLGLLTFGVPLLPHALGRIALESSNRYFLKEMVSFEELGLFDMGFQISKIIFILGHSFNLAYTPFLFRELTSEKINWIKIRKIQFTFFGVLLVSTILLNMIAPFLFGNIISADFSKSQEYIPYLTCGYLIWGVYLIFTAFIFYSEKTTILAVISILNILTSLISNYFLIDHFGAYGASIAFFVSNAIMTITIASYVFLNFNQLIRR